MDSVAYHDRPLGGFSTRPDGAVISYCCARRYLTEKFHAADWQDRHALLAGMQDVRLPELAGRLCSLYAPKSVPANVSETFWSMVKGRWDGTVAYGDDDKHPGNTYASVAEDLAKLADGQSFPIDKKSLNELKEFFDERKLQ